MLRLNSTGMVRNFELLKIGGAKFGLVLEANEVSQHRSFTALRDWVEFELWLAACLFGSQVLKLGRVFQQLGKTMRRRFPLLCRLVYRAYQTS